MKKNPYVYRGRAVTCGVLAIAAGVAVAAILPPAKTGWWSWTGFGTTFFVYAILFVVFCRRKS